MRNKVIFGVATGLMFAILLVVGGISAYRAIVEQATEQATERVLKQLKAEYVPGPYSPGVDPDKVETGWETEWESQRN